MAQLPALIQALSPILPTKNALDDVLGSVGPGSVHSVSVAEKNRRFFHAGRRHESYVRIRMTR